MGFKEVGNESKPEANESLERKDVEKVKEGDNPESGPKKEVNREEEKLKSIEDKKQYGEIHNQFKESLNDSMTELKKEASRNNDGVWKVVNQEINNGKEKNMNSLSTAMCIDRASQITIDKIKENPNYRITEKGTTDFDNGAKTYISEMKERLQNVIDNIPDKTEKDKAVKKIYQSAYDKWDNLGKMSGLSDDNNKQQIHRR